MTDDQYLAYRTGVLESGAQVCVGGNCTASELTAETPVLPTHRLQVCGSRTQARNGWS
jgi:hypothetical protein